MPVLRFSAAHIWARVEADVAVLGVSDYLQDLLGDITTVELADLGDMLRAGRRMGRLDSEEASSPLESPVSGEVVEVNQDVLENPDLINGEPYAAGWLLRVRLDAPTELEELMPEDEYTELTADL